MPSFDLVNFLSGLIVGLLTLYLFIYRFLRVIDDTATILVDVERELSRVISARISADSEKKKPSC